MPLIQFPKKEQPAEKPAGKKPGFFARIRGAYHHLMLRIPGYSHLRSPGDALYYLGFAAEYALIDIRHQTVAAFHRARKLVFRGVSGLVGRAAHVLVFSAHEVVAPFAYIHREFDITRTLVVFSYRQRGIRGAARQLANRMGMNHRTAAAMLKRSSMYLLPLFCGLMFWLTVHTVLSYNYVLQVFVNDAPVGYIANENVFDEACDLVNERVAMANELSTTGSKIINIVPTYTMAISNTVMDRDSMVDTILRVSSSEISQGSALYIDDELVAITTQGDRLRADLEALKAPYEEDDPSVDVIFGRDVEVVDGLYFNDSISSYEDVYNLINSTSESQQLYVVQEGDTIWSIAYACGLDSVDTLVAWNPQLADPDYELAAGQVITVGTQEKYLPIYVVRTVTYQEEIPYSEVTVETDELDWGTTMLANDGQNGLKEVTADVYYLEGEEQWRVVTDETVLQEPVDQRTLLGTRLKDGSIAATATGTIMWPVPNYRNVSRWMSSYHKGCDICAPRGTAILAADSGVVTAAGYNAGGTGYGNSIIINHGNGMTTLYAHCDELYVTVGQYVTQGQVIAAVGSTGNSSGNHCHFEIRINGTLVSAREYFPDM